MTADTNRDDTAHSLSVDVLDASGATTDTVELPAAVFGTQVNVPLIHQVVVAQQAAHPAS